MRFHIVHIISNPRLHGLFSYSELIGTLQWGLNELGHDTTAAVNSVGRDRTNIVLGGQMLGEGVKQFPPDTIFYNTEQMVGAPPEDVQKVFSNFGNMGAQFRVWEYSQRNMEVWQQLQPKWTPTLVPVGWAPILRRIPKRENEDIDVLFYGLPSNARFLALNNLCNAWVKCVFACGLYGKERDELIARAKIVLNVNRYERSKIFEVVRVSYLLANEKAVVSDFYPESFIESDLKDAVAFTPMDGILETCQKLLKDDPARRELASRGRAAMERRDIREILRKALAALELA
ncbi:MAG TPA: glycosyltransferase [Tepidisphaeraceae bacterium]|jgi:hypothetical protein